MKSTTPKVKSRCCRYIACQATLVIEYLVGLVISNRKPVKPVMGRPTKARQRIEKEEAARLNLSVAELGAQSQIEGL